MSSTSIPTAASAPHVTTRIEDGIGLLTIDQRDRSMNVFTPELDRQLRTAFDALLADAAVTGIVICSGKSSFLAGADLAQMAAFNEPGSTPAQTLDRISAFGNLFRHIETGGKPVVAAASGTALGAGLELMLGCHYRIASDAPGAQFGLPEVKLGLLPGAGGTQRVVRIVGIAASIPLLTQGTALSAAEAHKLGLIHEVVPAASLIDAAKAALRDGRVNAVAPWDQKGFRLPGGDAYAPAPTQALVAANASLHAAHRDHMPAPLAILRCVYEGARLPIDKGLRLEQKLFTTLVRDPVAHNLIRTLFFARQSADKLVRRPIGVAPSKVQRLGIVGAGFMGAGIAEVSALAGIEVVLIDRDKASAQRGYESVQRALDAAVARQRLTADRRDAALARVRAVEHYADLAGCDLVIEAVVEDAGIKAKVTAACEAVLGDRAILASNTSALPIGELAAASTRRDRFIGLHFFSPVSKMALVEVIRGRDTSDETLARALDYVRQIRKTPIIVNDGPGFYTTRCVDAYLREGLHLLADGVDPVLIENAAVALGMPVGPLALADEVGIDVAHHVAHFLAARESGPAAVDRHARANALLDAKVGAGQLGRKSGAGFYAYPEGAPRHLQPALRSAATAATQPASSAVQQRLLYAQVIEATRCWAEGVATDASDTDLGAVLGWAFPAYLGGPLSVVDQTGAAEFVRRCDALVASCGARFMVPVRLRDFAASGARFHTT